MKKVVLFFAMLIIGFSISAQHVFDKGSLMFNAGLGAPVNYGYIPTINFSGDYGVIPTGDVGIVGFGGLAEIQFADYDWYYNGADGSGMKPIFIFGPRATWHLLVFESDEFDVYGGVGFGIMFRGQPYDDYYSSTVSGYGEGFVGGRWMFQESLGLFAEVGGGSRSFLKGGITFNF
jgi:hypothetical protein